MFQCTCLQVQVHWTTNQTNNKHGVAQIMIAAHDEDEWIASSARETEHAHFTNRLSFFLSLAQTVCFSLSLKKLQLSAQQQLMNILSLFVNCGCFFRALFLSFLSINVSMLFFYFYLWRLLCMCVNAFTTITNSYVCSAWFSSIKSWLSSTLTPLNARANEIVSVKHMIQMNQKRILA